MFFIDGLYEKIKHIPYIEGRKKELEIMMMNYWLTNIVGNESYWKEYINNDQEVNNIVNS